jgi:hypothetical protein
MKWPGGDASYGSFFLWEEDVRREYVTIRPNETFEFEARLKTNFHYSDSPKRRLRLGYFKNGNAQGEKAWIGTVDVSVGADSAVRGARKSRAK